MSKTDIKDALLAQFKSMNAKPKDSLDQRWFSMTFMQSLSPDEQKLVNPVLKEMEEEGLVRVEIRLSAQVVILTEKGFEIINQ